MEIFYFIVKIILIALFSSTCIALASTFLEYYKKNK
jgi:hypothetical protein